MWKFREQEIGLYDFLLLTKDDLVELDLPIAARNRIIAFQKHYANEGLGTESGEPTTNFDMTEVIKNASRSESATACGRRTAFNNTQMTMHGGYSKIDEEPCEIILRHQRSQEKKEDTGRKQRARPRTALDMSY